MCLGASNYGTPNVRTTKDPHFIVTTPPNMVAERDDSQFSILNSRFSILDFSLTEFSILDFSLTEFLILDFSLTESSIFDYSLAGFSILV